jgi:hypothetical protein
MNKQEEFGSDLLSRYIRPGKISKAPSGFTGRVMTRIRSEKITASKERHFLSEYKVPLISSGVMLLLVIAAVITNSAAEDSSVIAFLKPVSDLINRVSAFNIGKLQELKIPGWFAYTMTGIFILTMFDGVMYSLFKRRRKS